MAEEPFRDILSLRRVLGYQKEGAENTKCFLNYGSYIAYTKPDPAYLYNDGSFLRTMTYTDGEVLDGLDAQPFDVTLKGEYVYRVYDPTAKIYIQRDGKFYELSCSSSEPVYYPE
ncbi:MAG: hypothetical protein IJ071_11025 [Ruminococcus sp.]|nr:hypothetical protein [Ruminococcus sp.]